MSDVEKMRQYFEIAELVSKNPELYLKTMKVCEQSWNKDNSGLENLLSETNSFLKAQNSPYSLDSKDAEKYALCVMGKVFFGREC